ncbi:MAG: nitroreductase [Saprospiraceae bacterium]
MQLAEITDLIHRRRAIFPKFYLIDQPVDRSLIEQLLENANQAPTHKLTQPWRFIVFHSLESRQRLGDYLADYYVQHTPPELFSAEKKKKTAEKPRQSGAVIALCRHFDPANGLPEWEETAALACAVENMWLSCTAAGLGCYWSSPKAALEAGDFLELGPGDSCFGLFYLGWHNMPETPGKRRPVAERTIWK